MYKDKKIILIQSNSEKESLGEKIIDAGFHCNEVEKPIDASEILEKNAQEMGLIIADMDIGGRVFQDFLEKLKSNDETRFIPVLALIGSSDEAGGKVVSSSAYNENIEDFIQKPIRLEELLLRISRLLRVNESFLMMQDKVKGSDKLVHVLEKRLSEVSSIYQSIKRHAEKQKLAVEAKEENFYTMAHDLKSPLHNIYLAMDLLRENTNLSEDDLDLVDSTKETTKRVNRVIQNFLTQIKEGHSCETIHLSSVMPSTIMEISLREFYPQANQKNILITLEMEEELREVNWDNTAILRVVSNLLDNAIKFSPEDSDVFMFLLQNPETTKIYVRDQGPGISEQEQERIFDMFYQSAEHGQGYGIGLAWCKKTIEKHGGNIQVISGPGLGTEIEVVLPNHPDLNTITTELELP